MYWNEEIPYPDILNEEAVGQIIDLAIGKFEKSDAYEKLAGIEEELYKIRMILQNVEKRQNATN